MTGSIESLLDRLEKISADAVAATDPARSTADAPIGAELIEERGKLIEEFRVALGNISMPLSYTDWNRLVIVHHQGVRIHDNLQRTRSELVAQLTANCREQAFLECVAGMVEPSHHGGLIESA